MNSLMTPRESTGSTTGLPPLAAAFAFTLWIWLASCDPVPEIRAMDWGDVSPPALLEQSIDTAGTILLRFDEAVRVVGGSLRVQPGLTLAQAPYYPDEGDKSLLSLSIGGNAVPGSPYTFEISVADGSGNDIYVVLPFYGPNAHPAKLLLNEVLTKSSTNNRDAVEFIVTQSGDLGGLTCAIGTPQNFDARFVFPSRQVNAGDFVIVHCKPENLPEERDETAGKTQSGGKNASASAWDFWMRDSSGLPDTTGIVTLASTPMGPIVDALFYTDKVSEEGKDYRSFGTKKMLDRADILAAAKSWSIAGTAIRVEDGAVSTGCTATRSICRNTALNDTDRARDWHIVPSGGLSLGSANTDEIYEAPSSVDH